MQYELILFDADGTLFDYDKAEAYALENAFSSAQIPYQKEFIDAYKIINSSLWRDFEKGLISPAKIRVERFDQLFDQFKIKTDTTVFGDVYLDFFAEAGFLIDGAEDIVNIISSQTTTAIITNGLSIVQRSRFSKAPIMSQFKDVIISEEVGCAKPNPKIFEITFEKLNHKNKNTTMIIGDSLTSDIQGGINFGITTCWFNPKKLPNNSGLIPDFEIQTLDELIELVGL
ncbi:YjjG family noncanonical pyrimidine nucleotidase [bacterium]|nr:YjjG family noncanonical pyrimidine nucleotidase [bacterium]